MHMQVQQLHPASAGSGTAWDGCVASVAADGTLGILSLRAGGFCQRLLHGHPPGSRLQLQWAASLGFLACLSPATEQQAAVAIVWDLHSGEQTACSMLLEICG